MEKENLGDQDTSVHDRSMFGDSLDFSSFRDALKRPDSTKSTSSTTVVTSFSEPEPKKRAPKPKRRADDIYEGASVCASLCEKVVVKTNETISVHDDGASRLSEVNKQTSGFMQVDSSPSKVFAMEVQQLEESMKTVTESIMTTESGFFSPLPKISVSKTHGDEVGQLIENISNEIEKERKEFKAMVNGGAIPDILSPIGAYKHVMKEKKKAEQLQAERDRLKEQLEQLSERCGELENNAAAPETITTTQSTPSERHQDSIDTYEKKLDDQNREIEDLRNRHEEKNRKIKNLQKEYDIIEDELLETLDHLDELQDDMWGSGSSVEELKILQAEVERLQYELCESSRVNTKSKSNEIPVHEAQGLDEPKSAIVETLEETADNSSSFTGEESHNITQEHTCNDGPSNIVVLKKKLDQANMKIKYLHVINSHLLQEKSSPVYTLKKRLEIVKVAAELTASFIPDAPENTKSMCFHIFNSSFNRVLPALQFEDQDLKPKSKPAWVLPTFKSIASDTSTTENCRPSCPVGKTECAELNGSSQETRSNDNVTKKYGNQKNIDVKDEVELPARKELVLSPSSAFRQVTETSGGSSMKLDSSRIPAAARSTKKGCSKESTGGKQIEEDSRMGSLSTPRRGLQNQRSLANSSRAARSRLQEPSKPQARTTVKPQRSNIVPPKTHGSAMKKSKIVQPNGSIPKRSNLVKPKASGSTNVRKSIADRPTLSSTRRASECIRSKSDARSGVTSRLEPSAMGQKAKSRLPKFGQNRQVPSKLLSTKVSTERGTAKKKKDDTNRVRKGVAERKASKEERVEAENTPLLARKKNGYCRPNEEPVETIDEVPAETPLLDRKFDNLFQDWSSTKKPTNGSPCSHFPTVLDFDASAKKRRLSASAKKAEPPTKKSNMTKYWDTLHKDSTPQYKAYANSPMTDSFLGGSLTPLVVRNVVVDVFSPEDMLLSPTMDTQTHRKSENHRNESAAIKIQKALRGWSCRMMQKKKSEKATTIQSRWRQFYVRKQYYASLNVIETSLLCVSEPLAALQIQKWYRCIRDKIATRKQDAARCIQTCWRRQMREQTLQRSALFIQQISRSYVARKRVVAMKLQRRQLWAACLIQRSWASYRTQSATIGIQRWIRGIFATREVVRMKHLRSQRSVAAVTIQCWWRYLRAKELSKARSQAIVVLQCALRRSLAKAQLSELQMELKSVKAATEMQRVWRGRLARKNVSTMNLAARVLQSAARLFIATRLVSKLRQEMKEFASAQYIQNWWLDVLSTRREKERIRLDSVILIQTAARRLVAKKRTTGMKNEKARWKAAVTIQSVWRGRQDLHLARERLAAIVQIQSLLRRLMAKSALMALLNYHQTFECAIKIQYWWRKERMDNLMKMHTASATIIQTALRCWFARKLLHNRKLRRNQRVRAVVVLQCFFRERRAQGYVASLRMSQRILQKKSESASKIQTTWRRFNSRCTYMKKLNGAIQIQQLVRASQAKSRVSHLREEQKIQRVCSAIVLQTFVRRSLASMKVSAMLKDRRLNASMRKLPFLSTKEGQAKFDEKLRTVMGKRRDAASKIQHCWKRYCAREVKKCLFTSSAPENPQPIQVTTHSRRPLGELKTSNQIFSPLKTRRGTKVVGNNVMKKQAASIAGQENFARTRNSKPLPTGELPFVPIQSMKVVELRQELENLGVPKKDIRKLRKAELVSLLSQRREL